MGKNTRLKNKLHRIIFTTETPSAKLFDVGLLFLICFSVFAVILESVPQIYFRFKAELFIIEWIITIMFSIEYFVRIWITRGKKTKYIFSFYGIIDLLSILPSFLGFIFIGAHQLMIIRALRLLRIFRVFKLNRYTNEGSAIIDALISSRRKISVFLFGILTVVLVIGTLMYLVEGEEGGFSSIPRSMYWAIVTLTTVGYGDIAPITSLGRFIASALMILGYAIIAVPTGIVTAELTRSRIEHNSQTCPNCRTISQKQANFCSNCGTAFRD